MRYEPARTRQIASALQAMQPSERRTGRLAMGTMASGQAIELPYLLMRGSVDGPCLWLNSAVHGDEINGVLAVLDFYRSVDPVLLRGSLVVTPVANPLGFDARRKRVPQDDGDLDQAFPGRADGLTSDRLAHTLFSEIEGVADVLISFHTMNPYFDSHPYVVFKAGDVDEDLVLAAAVAFDPFAICRMPIAGGAELPGNIAGALDYQALRVGALAFMVELGGGSRQEPAYVAQGVTGLHRVSRHLGLLECEFTTIKPTHLVSARNHVSCSQGGLFRQQARPGTSIAPGVVLGVVENLWGEVVETISFDFPVLVLGLRNDPVVHSGDRVAFIATRWTQTHG